MQGNRDPVQLKTKINKKEEDLADSVNVASGGKEQWDSTHWGLLAGPRGGHLVIPCFPPWFPVSLRFPILACDSCGRTGCRRFLNIL